MKMNDRYAWPGADARATNTASLAQRIAGEIDGYERAFGISSACLLVELSAGHVAEDERISNWLIALETLRALRNGQ
ncbi:MAG: hypothetical protein HS107_14820 [Thermoflexaceae bacterium]|nr:hypothetical protein [Thermoflexaceae bacterium]